MNFGSKKVYVYNQSDEESVSDDSDSEWSAPPRNTNNFSNSNRMQFDSFVPQLQTDSIQHQQGYYDDEFDDDCK